MENVIKIIDELTALKKDTDLFAYDMPLGKSGLWISDSQTPSRFNDTGVQRFDIYYRGKVKASGLANTKYLKDTIDSLRGSTGTCSLADGTSFRLSILYSWDFLEKDYEGYFVWSNQLELLCDEPADILSA